MDWNDLQNARLAVITDLAAQSPTGSMGRTALMKFCYLLQVVRKVPLGYRFTLYSYGPFDSSVLSDLNGAESLKAVESSLHFYAGGYGYQIKKGERSGDVIEGGRKFLEDNRESIDWVLSEFGSHTSADLELESTLIYVDREAVRKSEHLSIQTLAQRVRDLKPRFTVAEIQDRADQLRSKNLLNATQMAARA